MPSGHRRFASSTDTKLLYGLVVVVEALPVADLGERRRERGAKKKKKRSYPKIVEQEAIVGVCA